MRRKGTSGRPKGAPLGFFLILIGLSALILALVARRPSGKALVLTPASLQETAGQEEPSVEPEPLFPVHVDGAVQRPGVYYFSRGSLVGDAIEKAGGRTPEADLAPLNLAMLVQAHMKIYVPSAGQENLPFSMDDWQEPPGGLVDLNRAGSKELESLPGIGQATARAIIEYREAKGPFGCIEDLMQVPGIKEGRFEKLKERITVSRP